ncbi:hypothetical protein [Pectinatus haikarae]|uniref:Uncharacterized protein n=1 Tax=Pectinatus haikarae TaxID=349096 RepID=A0ABT9Y8Z9_9FIRM|nr:hypothetical protein [Pectinatus haikarae]MDQ0204320.1 hypothetical protein [Pectinatus haikarae]
MYNISFMCGELDIHKIFNAMKRKERLCVGIICVKDMNVNELQVADSASCKKL